MAIEWSSDLEIGVEDIDLQHRELIDRINILLHACGEGKGGHEVRHLIAFLEDYVITHFSREERVMREHNFPAYASHKTEHEFYVARISELKQLFRTEGGNIQVVLMAINASVSWLSNHIRKTDKAIGLFLMNRPAQGKAAPVGRTAA